MYNTNLAYSITNTNLPVWDYIVSETTSVFNLTENESEKIRTNKLAKLIAAIPFVAGCNNPERIAISHIGLCIMEIKGFQRYCCHLPSDDKDIYIRLERISHFDGGDAAIIKHGMALLALAMLEGYKKSISKDLLNNTYNPLASKAWNYREIKKTLQNTINEIDCPELDSLLFPVMPMAIPDGWLGV